MKQVAPARYASTHRASVRAPASALDVCERRRKREVSHSKRRTADPLAVGKMCIENAAEFQHLLLAAANLSGISHAEPGQWLDMIFPI
jgi:hypothetical protein